LKREVTRAGSMVASLDLQDSSSVTISSHVYCFRLKLPIKRQFIETKMLTKRCMSGSRTLGSCFRMALSKGLIMKGFMSWLALLSVLKNSSILLFE
jgi:hypothetical protein